MDTIIGTGWSQYMSLIDSFKVFLSFKPCVESDGRVGKVVVKQEDFRINYVHSESSSSIKDQNSKDVVVL